MSRKLKTTAQRTKCKVPLRRISDKPEKFFETKEFKKLNAKWHRKLESTGFYDFEEFDSPMQLMKTHENERFRTKFTGDEFIAKQRYYELASQLLHDYHFRNSKEQNIWKLHCEGESVKSTSEKLKIKSDSIKTFLAEIKKRIVK